ncbi:MAG: sialate O-acetylesterase [Planctomycetota bacterium]
MPVPLRKLWFAPWIMLLTFASMSHAEHYDVYLLAGQSNMDGRGSASDLTEADQLPFVNAIIFYRNAKQTSQTWCPLSTGFSVPPKFKGDLPSSTFGPEIGFTRILMEHSPEQKIALIKGSQGGTSLKEDWKPGTKGDLRSQGPQYADFIETIAMATEQLSRQGDSWALRGLLWHQGESDSKSSQADYQRRLTEFIRRLREDLDHAELPIVVGEVYDNGNRDSVRAATRVVAADDPTVGLVSSDGTKTWDPGTHFDARSQLLLGKRYASAMLMLQSE